MKSKAQKFIIAGNWKMNPDTLADAKAIFSAISRKASAARSTTVLVAPPAPFIASLLGKKQSVVGIAIQDVSDKPFGAVTGSVSARQAKSAGAEYAIIGHSERRAMGDSDETVAAKAREALGAGLRVILCVGETERDAHARYLQSIRQQLLSVFSAVDRKFARSIIIAYEPVWAVGKSYDIAPKPSDIHEMSIFIRKTAAEVLGKKDGLKIPVLYGGSVDFENAQNILREGAIDGLLIGRQSLDPKAFGNIIAYADSL